MELEGLCHLQLGAIADALKVLGRAIAERPERSHAHYLLGFALREAGRAAEAVSPLATALRLAPEEPVYLRALAELYSELGRHSEALVLAARAAELAPSRPANHVTWGYVASNSGDKELARREYERALALDPTDAAAWNNLGCLDLSDGRPLQARARFREALRLDPRGERAQRNLKLVVGGARILREWDEIPERVCAELVRASAPAVTVAALVLESPSAGRALITGGTPGAALSAAALVAAVRMMGPLAWAPLGVAAAMAGAAWIANRRAWPEARARVRRVLSDGRAEFERIRRQWVSGAVERAQRDLQLEALIEKMALDLVERNADE